MCGLPFLNHSLYLWGEEFFSLDERTAQYLISGFILMRILIL